MKTQVLVLVSAVVLFVTSGIGADEPPSLVVPGIVAAAPLPPAPQESPASAYHAAPQISQVEHLRLAAEHLEAAGAEEMAQEIRAEAEALLASSVERLEELRGRLAQLQQEIADLEQLTGCNQQIMLRCKIVEINMAQMRQLGVDVTLLSGDETAAHGSIPTGVNEAGLMDAFIDALQAQGLAKVLAEPVLVTTNRRPVSLHSGGEFPILIPAGADGTTVEWRKIGLMLEAVPVVLGGGKVRLDLAPELATRDFGNAVTVGDTVIPGLNVRRLNTQVEMQFGETVTLVMGNPIETEGIQQVGGEAGAADSQTVTVFCVTPEVVHPAPTRR